MQKTALEIAQARVRTRQLAAQYEAQQEKNKFPYWDWDTMTAKPHTCEITRVTNKVGTYLRCRLCGEFPPPAPKQTLQRKKREARQIEIEDTELIKLTT